MRFDNGYDERYVALLNKCVMARGEDGLFKAGGVDLGAVLRLKRFSELAKEFVETPGVAFEYCRAGGDRVKSTAVGKRLIRLIRGYVGGVDEVYTLEPYAELVLDEIDLPLVCALLDHIKLADPSREAVETLNKVSDNLREKSRGVEFRRKLNSYHRSANKNYKELIRYEQALFDCYSRLLVVRVDLSYKKEFGKVEQKVALQHRKRLFDNARSNNIFEHMVGYVTKLEHGMEKGFHFHCLFFFDGSKVREDITLARRVGEYWQSVIAKGTGCYYNCNYAKEKYRQCGIGMIAHTDTEKREGLRLALVYLAKTDLYMKLKAEGRALTKGVMPGLPSGLGRPRKT